MGSARQPKYRYGPMGGLAIGFLVAMAAVPATGSEPLFPLPAPLYSFDLESPTIRDEPLRAGDVFALSEPIPSVAVPSFALGLGPADELDALSSPTFGLASGAYFTIQFSVDRATVGLAAPLPWQIQGEVPYNAKDQARRGQAAGDLFMTIDSFTLDGRVQRRGTGNNGLVRNNFNEGGTDYAALPTTHARDDAGPQAEQDEVDASGQFPSSTRSDGPANVFFTLTSESPALQELSFPFEPSGANIFYNEAPGRGSFTTMYADAMALGLAPADDIDALVVIDRGLIGEFGAGDAVLFSLAPGSFTLLSRGGTGGADIFLATPGLPQPMPLAFAAWLGLGDGDNVDALDVFICGVDGCPPDLLRLHGIRAVAGDFDDDGVVGAADFTEWGVGMTGPDVGPPAPEYIPYDLDYDADVDLHDMGLFQHVFMQMAAR